MAAIACPTWAECQTMSQLELEAINIVKGETQGDTFNWKYQDPETGAEIGMWQSAIDKNKPQATVS